MASDTDDDQEGSRTPPQLENAISELKSQSYSSGLSGSSNAGALENLVGAYSAVLDLDDKIAQLEEKTREEEQRQRAFKLSEYSDDVIKHKEAQQQKERYEAEKAKELDRIAKINDKIYEAFNATYEKELAKQKEHTNNLGEALEATRAGRPISEELKKKIRDPKRREADKEHTKKVVEVYRTAKAEHELLDSEIQKIDSKLSELPENHQERKNLLEIKNKHTERQKVASGALKKADEHIDQKLTQLERIVDGVKAAEEKKVNQEFHKELEKDAINDILAFIGKDVLLECAQKRGPVTTEVLRNLVVNKEEMKEILQEAVKEVVRKEPNAADMIRDMLDQAQKDNSSTKNLRPSSTPNIKDTVPSKGHGGLGV